ncbi:hypothetical protein EG329_012749 [Mollisiaceae sp. DMI_Dod_QoI]|nr:hypothetical protein EG329_012749 [Helotiales sp. DMI_Dod_QoI]
MGGQAFAHHVPPLSTPRMPGSIYQLMRDAILTVLRIHYTDAKTPIEAPGKGDYGDIDILVHGPLTLQFDPAKTHKKEVAQAIGSKIHAHALVVGQAEQPMHFAVRWPKEKVVEPRNGGTTVQAVVDDHEARYIQVDVHVCKDFRTFRWEYFHSAHGDLWNILGSTIRKFGFTVNDKGLFIRIPEIEQFDKKKSMVFLTEQPVCILDFLGLNPTRWFMEFETRKDMFEYAAGCRLFWVKDELALEDGEMEGDVVGDIDNGGQTGGEAGKKKLKHNDRQRMAKRPIFKEWIEDFIPQLRAEGKYCDAKCTREQIRDEAFAQFGVKEEWDLKLKEWKLGRHTDELWRDVIKGSVPESLDPQQRAATIRELKEIIMEGQPFQGIVPDAAKKDEEGFYDFEKVRDFIKQNLKTVGEVGWKKQQQRAMERMRESEQKKRKVDPENP